MRYNGVCPIELQPIELLAQKLYHIRECTSHMTMELVYTVRQRQVSRGNQTYRYGVVNPVKDVVKPLVRNAEVANEEVAVIRGLYDCRSRRRSTCVFLMRPECMEAGK